MTALTLRLATPTDLDEVMNIIEGARHFIAQQGFNQWQDGYPAQTDMLADIMAQRLYVLTDQIHIAAVAAVLVGVDPNYRLIETGGWLSYGQPYAAIHRVAVGAAFRGQHVGERLFSALVRQLQQTHEVASLRVDTHEANRSMQHLITKVGFIDCGRIYIDGVAPRRAYELFF